MKPQRRLILVEANDAFRDATVRRLEAQGYLVEATADAAEGANMALAEPPDALIADLWMPSISGVQLCRLLRAEPATAEVPVILLGDLNDTRSQFWATRAGAAAYVERGRMAELTRVLAKEVSRRSSPEGFFLQLSGGSADIRDRIAKHLDLALFESVIAAEVRALATHTSFEQLFDRFFQFFSQVVHYRWVAIHLSESGELALHAHPANAAQAESEARAALAIPEDTLVLPVTDEDAYDRPWREAPLVYPIAFGFLRLGTLALSLAVEVDSQTMTLVRLVSRELAGPIRITALIEESRHLATTDALTGLLNRRAFTEMMRVEIERCRRYGMPLSVLILDIDHFKTINDTFGHAGGDQALCTLGKHLRQVLRVPDSLARWGGEEFVIALKSTDLAGAQVVAERILGEVRALAIETPSGVIKATLSIGVTAFDPQDSMETMIERADRALYAAKAGGRDRMVVAPIPSAPAPRPTKETP